MADVDAEIGKVKAELSRALARRGLALIRLQQAAKNWKNEATAWEEQVHACPSTAALTFVPMTFDARSETEDYNSQQRDISECIEQLRLLRVPQTEIDEILKAGK